MTKKIIQIVALILSLGWILPLNVAIYFLCAHYKFNVVGHCVNSFPHLESGMWLLSIAGIWMGYSGILVMVYVTHRILTGKWIYPFGGSVSDGKVG